MADDLRIANGADPQQEPSLTERQALVLRAIVAGYVGEAAPVGSRSLSHVLPIARSRPHRSATP